MKILKDDLKNLAVVGKVQKFTYTDGNEAWVLKRDAVCLNKPSTLCAKFPPINRNEPMTKAAYRRTLNRYFEKLIELDLQREKCLFLTLTIKDEKYNTYNQVSEQFNSFTDKVRFSKKVCDSYIGTIRFIEIQAKGFYHIHCVLVFSKSDIQLTWKDLHRMWGWGFVKVKYIYDFVGLMDYLTNAKIGSNSLIESKFTRYPKGARVIYVSPNLPKAKSIMTELSVEDCGRLFEDDNSIGHIKFHKYFDPITHRVRCRVDKMLIIKNLLKGGSCK